jgi:SAM-dependent methyltransferase
MTEEYLDQITEGVLDEETFLRLTLAGPVRGQASPWRKVVVRPVLVRNRRQLQFSYFDARQDTTKNHEGPVAAEQLAEILSIPFSSVHLQATTGDLRVQRTKSGKVQLHREKPSLGTAPELAHNTAKNLPLPAGKPDPFLQRIGIMNQQGVVSPPMQGKFSQINAFLTLLEHTGELERFGDGPVEILDCGCGSSYLSLATYHYLNNIRDIPARLTGIDTNQRLIEKSNQHGDALGFDRICFQTTAIADFVPETRPDIVIALHACNTATDDALAQGVLNQAQLIMCAPCCHHELHEQLHAVPPFGPVFQHGILRQRMGDLLTDTFRALILRICGYKTDVVEFVSPEHTDRNLMIRAVRQPAIPTRHAAREYQELKAFWGVTPYLERLLTRAGIRLPGTEEPVHDSENQPTS